MSTADLEPVARRLEDVLRGITDEHMSDPTPCEDYTVGDLIDHVRTFALAFTDAAYKAPPDPEAKASGDASRLGPDWRTEVPENLDALATAWKAPDAWTGMTRAGPYEMPGEIAGVVALDELVLHGWDLARATGQDYGDIDPVTLEVIHGFVVQATGDSGPDHRIFGPPIVVPDDAPLFDQVLGLAGRDPHWSPS
jgi:uncharacterized protein (TIGR03086 family)